MLLLTTRSIELGNIGTSARCFGCTRGSVFRGFYSINARLFNHPSERCCSGLGRMESLLGCGGVQWDAVTTLKKLLTTQTSIAVSV